MARRICFKEQYDTHTKDITMSGKIAGNIRPKQCIIFGRFFVNISGFINSFGLASCVVQDIIIVLHWIAAGSPRESICERSKWISVPRMMPIWQSFGFVVFDFSKFFGLSPRKHWLTVYRGH